MQNLNLFLLIFYFIFQIWPATSHGRITGGRNSTIFEYPYMAALERKELIFCAGSILSRRWILTAAHCLLDKKPPEVLARVGTSTRESGGSVMKVKQFYIHGRFDFHSTQNDLAALELHEPIRYSSVSKPIELVKPGIQVAPGTICLVSGWGSLSTYGSFPETLHTVRIPLWSKKDCQKAYGRMHLSSDKICAGSPGMDSCQADSGAPLVCSRKQVGVVSWGFKCGDPNHPGVYTNIALYHKWIMEVCMDRGLVRSNGHGWVHFASQRRSNSKTDSMANFALVLIGLIVIALNARN